MYLNNVQSSQQSRLATILLDSAFGINMLLVWFIIHWFIFPMKWLEQIQIYYLFHWFVKAQSTPQTDSRQKHILPDTSHGYPDSSELHSVCLFLLCECTWVSCDYKSLWYPADSKETFIKTSLKSTVQNTGLLLPWGISYQSFFRMLSLLTALNKLLLKLSMYLHQILSLTKQELGDPKMLQFIFASLVYKNC